MLTKTASGSEWSDTSITASGNNTFTGTNKFNQKLQVSDLTGNIGSNDYGIFISAMDGIKCVALEGDSATSYKQFKLNSEYVEFHAGDIVYTQKLTTAMPLSQDSSLRLPDKASGTLATTDDRQIHKAADL